MKVLPGHTGLINPQHFTQFLKKKCKKFTILFSKSAFICHCCRIVIFHCGSDRAVKAQRVVKCFLFFYIKFSLKNDFWQVFFYKFSFIWSFITIWALASLHSSNAAESGVGWQSPKCPYGRRFPIESYRLEYPSGQLSTRSSCLIRVRNVITKKQEIA